MEKKDILAGYINTQISLLPSLSSQYTNNGQNLTRVSFLNLKRMIEQFLNNKEGDRLVIMPGLRGVGKTTLLFQLYEHIARSKLVEKDHLMYISCDHIVKTLNSSLAEILETYEEKIISESLEVHKKKIIFLIDEAHYDSSWEITVKRIFDRTKNAFVFVSGSSSLELETSTDTARRAIIERIYPLNLMEFALIKYKFFPPTGNAKQLREAILLSANAKEAFEKLSAASKLTREFLLKIPSYSLEIQKYLFAGGFPNVLFDSDEKVFKRVISILEKIIYDDLPKAFPLTKEALPKIFPILTALSGQLGSIAHRTLTGNIDRLTLPQLSDIFEALSKAGVITPVSISSNSTMSIAKKSKKYYFMTPTIRAAILWHIGKFNKTSETLGLLLEDAAFNTLYKIKVFTNLLQSIDYPKEDDGKSCDFIVQTPTGKIALECGWGIKDVSQIRNMLIKEKAKYGIIVDGSTERLAEKDNILFVPKEIFLMMA